MSVFDEESVVMDNEEDEYNGFEIYDANDVYRRKIMLEALRAADEETIASPIPENEQKVIVDNAHFFGLSEGARLKIVLSGGGIVEHNGKKIADLKPAFVARLIEKRGGSFARVTLYSFDPPMIKMEFSMAESSEFNVKIC